MHNTQITHDAANHSFILHMQDGTEAGRLDYRTGGGRLNAMRTYVDPAHRGKGYATQLLDAFADFARGEGMRIVPICSFVKDEFARHPEKYADVIAPPRVSQ